MSEKKNEQGAKKAEKKAEPARQSAAEGEAGKSAKAKKPVKPGLKATTEKVSQTAGKVSRTAKRAGERAASGAARVGKTAQELGEGIQEKFENDIAPAAERARRGVSETARKVKEELGPRAQQARQGLSETSKKVREEVGPVAEKAGKGISAVFKATARATRKSARILGIKASITTDLRKRQKLLAELGEAYLRMQKKKTPAKSDKDALEALVAEIGKIDADIQALEAKEKATRESS